MDVSQATDKARITAGMRICDGPPILMLSGKAWELGASNDEPEWWEAFSGGLVGQSYDIVLVAILSNLPKRVDLFIRCQDGLCVETSASFAALNRDPWKYGQIVAKDIDGYREQHERNRLAEVVER